MNALGFLGDTCQSLSPYTHQYSEYAILAPVVVKVANKDTTKVSRENLPKAGSDDEVDSESHTSTCTGLGYVG